MTTMIVAEYDGSPFTFQDDDWFNATTAAKSYGRRPGHWLDLPETERYINALCQRYKAGKSGFVRTRRGGNTRKPGASGTWLHPKLAVRFMDWLNVDFAIWGDEQIDRILRNGLAGGSMDDLSTVSERHERDQDV